MVHMHVDPTIVGISAIAAFVSCTTLTVFSFKASHDLTCFIRAQQNSYLQQITKYKIILLALNPILFVLASLMVLLSHYIPKIYNQCVCDHFVAFGIAFFIMALYGIKFGLVIGFHSILDFLQIRFKTTDQISHENNILNYRKVICFIQCVNCIIMSVVIGYFSESDCIRSAKHGYSITFEPLTTILTLVLMVIDLLLIAYYVRTLYFKIKSDYPIASEMVWQQIIFCSQCTGVIFFVTILDIVMHITLPEYSTIVIFNANCVLVAFGSCIVLYKLATVTKNYEILESIHNKYESKSVSSRRSLHVVMTPVKSHSVVNQERTSRGTSTCNSKPSIGNCNHLHPIQHKSQSRSITVPSANSNIASLSPLEFTIPASPSGSNAIWSEFTVTHDIPFIISINSKIVSTDINDKYSLSSISSRILSENDKLEYCELCQKRILVRDGESSIIVLRLHKKIFHTDYFQSHVLPVA